MSHNRIHLSQRCKKNKTPATNNAKISIKSDKITLFRRNFLNHVTISFAGGNLTRIFTKAAHLTRIWRDFLSHTDLTDENRLIYSADAAVLTRICTRFLTRIGTTCGDMWKSVFLETRSGF